MKTTLLFDPIPPKLQWACYQEGVLSRGTCEPEAIPIASILSRLSGRQGVQVVASVLYNGGNKVLSAGEVLTNGTLANLEQAIGILPEYNELTCRALKNTTVILKSVPHVVLCETGFFSGMPLEAATYAVPEKLRKRELRRFGGDGLLHEWVWKKMQHAYKDKARRVLSVHLGDAANVAAILDGKAIETTIGFTPIEGIMSKGGSGDLDPTVIFHLLSSGFSIHEVNHLLSQESGLNALLGKEGHIEDTVRKPVGKRQQFVREMYKYQLLKAIGALISILEGVDSIVFVSRKIDKYIGFVREVCGKFDFLGLTCHEGGKPDRNLSVLTGESSPVKVCCFKYDRWQVLAEKTNEIINGEGGNHD